MTTTAWFDGLPNGTRQVILRFFDEQCPEWQPGSGQAPMFYPGGGEAVEVRVLAEATIDLSTGEASPSQTYQEEGLSYAGDYRQSFRSLRWTLPFDDRDMVQLGQAGLSSVTAIPGLFQNGKTLWSLVYDKENGQMEVRFATDGPARRGLECDGYRRGRRCGCSGHPFPQMGGNAVPVRRQLLLRVGRHLGGPGRAPAAGDGHGYPGKSGFRETVYQREVRLSEREW